MAMWIMLVGDLDAFVDPTLEESHPRSGLPFHIHVCVRVFLYKCQNFQGKWGCLDVFFDSFTDLCNIFTPGLDGGRELHSADVI